MNLPIHDAALQYPQHLAFEGVQKISYAELDKRVAQSVRQGLNTGDHIAWCPRNDVDAFLTFWMLQQQGCVACPVSHRIPTSQRNELLGQIDARWLPELLKNEPKSEPNQPTKKTSNEGDRRPATLILSSGSTGKPKAIVHTMSAHIESAKGAAENMPLQPGDRWLWSLPLYHISGLSILVRCAVAGATVIGVPADTRIDANLLHQQQVSHLSVVSTQLRRLLDDKQFPSPHLQYVLLGGSSVDPSLVVAARQRCTNVFTTYGLTEMASQVTTSDATSDPFTSGRLLTGRELKINERSDEILVRGKTLCMGYYEHGQVQPIVDEQGWFPTRDRGQWNENNQLIVKGRIDNMFVSGGENIYPENIERALLMEFDIEQAVVVPVPDDQFGFCPVAFIDGDLPGNWETRLREQLAGFEIPRKILAWATTHDGLKVNRKLLQRLATDQNKGA